MARQKQVFEFFTDSGHGWLKVSKKLLNELGIAKQITGFSYMRKEHAYLEEDVDCSTFLKAYESKYSKQIRVNEHYADRSKIRTYDSYTC